MFSTRISTIGFLVFQISTSSHTLAASLDYSRSTASSHPALIELSSATRMSHHDDNTAHSVSSESRSHLEASSKLHHIESRNIEKPKNKKKKDSTCQSRKSRKYRVRAKVEAVVDKVKDIVKPAEADSGETKSGDATYYGTGLGACGIVSNDNSMIAAASHLLFDSFPGATANPNLNPICGRKVKATYQGKSVEVEIVDRCTGCAMHDLDFSPTAFAKLGAMEVGRLHDMKWEWM